MMDHSGHRARAEGSGAPHDGGRSTAPVAHDRHEGHSAAMFRDKFWLALALTIPVVVLSPDIQRWFGYSLPALPGGQYYAAILGTIVFVYGGLVFLCGARTA